ncbi:MAG: extracellular solute-binding protein [Lachnospiraceae bacterium]|nr:extracellular solute-binding protein [Lachnospiraceae bacterium]
MKLQHKIIIVLMTVLVLVVGFMSYNGLNGMGFHKFLEKRESGTVYLWYTNELMSDYYNNVASIYNKSNKGVDVVPKLVSASEYLENIYQASIQGEEFPDLYVITNDVMEKAYLSGLTAPVENGAEVKSAFPEVALEAASYDDMLLGYPIYFDTSTLVYNKTMLEQIAYDQFVINAEAEGVENPEAIEVPEEDIANLVNMMIPKTIDELIELSNNIEAPEGLETVFKWNINDVFFNYFYLGEYTSLSADNIDIYNDNTAACMEIFKRVTEYFYMDAETVTTENVLDEFMQGKVLFTILDCESAVKLEAANAEGLLEFAYDYALIPDPGRVIQKDEEGNNVVVSGDTILQGRPLSTTTILVVNGYADQPLAAADFAEFMTMENYFTDQLYEKTGYIPAYNNAATSGTMEEVFKMEYEASVPMPNSMVTSNFWMLLENAFNEIWDGADAKETLEALEARLKNQIPGE